MDIPTTPAKMVRVTDVIVNPVGKNALEPAIPVVGAGSCIMEGAKATWDARETPTAKSYSTLLHTHIGVQV